MKNIVLRVKSISKSFSYVKAVSNILFSVYKGDIFAFMGPNGRGKITILRILLNIIKTDNGHIEWNLLGNFNYLLKASQKCE